MPTSPEEFASPSGWRAVADRSSSRGVPIAFAARTTTFASWRCSAPSRSIQIAPVARPRSFVSIFDHEAGQLCHAAIATFVASLDTLRLQMMENAINEELILRCEGKPLDRAKLH